MSFIALEAVGFSYAGASRPALEDITLSVEEGEYIALVGRNGSGKSTLLRLLNGLRSPSKGMVEVFGLDAALAANARAIRSRLALVFQAPLDQIVSTVVEEDVAFGPENLGLERLEIERRVAAALESAGLEEERRSPSLFLSAGQQQRLAIAGALAMEPRCLAFDEATAMLDPPSRAALLDLVDGLNARGIAVIHATHDMEEAARARRVIALDRGRVVFDGPTEDFFSAGPGGTPSPSETSGFGIPPAVLAARAAGLEPRPAEGAAGLASRLRASRRADPLPGAAAALPPGTRPAAGAAPADAAFVLDNAGHTWLAGTANERVALSRVSLAVPRGSLVAVVGRTGSGKSTLLQLLDGLAFPTEGRVLSLGQDTLARDADLRSIRMRAPLAVQRPESALFEPFAADDVAFGPRNAGLRGKELVERVRSSMGRMGLPYEDFRDRGTRALSGGEKRRLALAGVLALEGEALLLDEPTSALDPETKEAVLRVLEGEASSGKTVVFATHSMEEAARADLVAVVRQGKLVALAPPGALFYEIYDEAWGIGLPFAAAVARASGDGRLALARPLSPSGLAKALCDTRSGAGGAAVPAGSPA